jgi:hypothetical protein
MKRNAISSAASIDGSEDCGSLAARELLVAVIKTDEQYLRAALELNCKSSRETGADQRARF